MLGTTALFTVISALAASYIQATSAAPTPAETTGVSDVFENIIKDLVAGAGAGEGISDVISSNRTSKGTLDPKFLPKIFYFAEFAAAAYCDPDHVVGTQVTCAKSVCPEITGNNVTTILEFSDTKDGDTTGLVARDDTTKSIVISIRGSKSIPNWLANLQVILKEVPEICSGCKVHTGFYKATQQALPAVMESVEELRKKNPGYTVVAVGHSLGGAVATLIAEEARRRGVKVDLYTFGAPRIGNEELSALISKSGTNFRVTHINDPVPHLPFVKLGYQHISPEYWISKGDTNIKSTDIQILEGGRNTGGNNNGQISVNITAHAHYLLPVKISSCAPPGLQPYI